MIKRLKEKFGKEKKYINKIKKIYNWEIKSES
jgi:hypothetical protein